MLGTIPKRTADSLIYTIDWSEWLNAGDTLATSTFAVPAGVTKVLETNTSNESKVQVSGGTNMQSYTITCTITTTVSGETKTETFILRIRD